MIYKVKLSKNSMAIFCCKNMSKLDTVVYLRFYLRLKYGQDYIMLMHHASCLHPLKPYMCAWVGFGLMHWKDKVHPLSPGVLISPHRKLIILEMYTVSSLKYFLSFICML